MAILNCIAIKSSHKPLTFTKKIWLAVYSRSNLIGVKYIHLSLTDWLTHSLIHRPITNSTRRLRGIFFLKNGDGQMVMENWTWTDGDEKRGLKMRIIQILSSLPNCHLNFSIHILPSAFCHPHFVFHHTLVSVPCFTDTWSIPWMYSYYPNGCIPVATPPAWIASPSGCIATRPGSIHVPTSLGWIASLPRFKATRPGGIATSPRV